jgi:hypothetical protein
VLGNKIDAKIWLEILSVNNFALTKQNKLIYDEKIYSIIIGDGSFVCFNGNGPREGGEVLW